MKGLFDKQRGNVILIKYVRFDDNVSLEYKLDDNDDDDQPVENADANEQKEDEMQQKIAILTRRFHGEMKSPDWVSGWR